MRCSTCARPQHAACCSYPLCVALLQWQACALSQVESCSVEGSLGERRSFEGRKEHCGCRKVTLCVGLMDCLCPAWEPQQLLQQTNKSKKRTHFHKHAHILYCMNLNILNKLKLERKIKRYNAKVISSLMFVNAKCSIINPAPSCMHNITHIKFLC